MVSAFGRCQSILDFRFSILDGNPRGLGAQPSNGCRSEKKHILLPHLRDQDDILSCHSERSEESAFGCGPKPV